MELQLELVGGGGKSCFFLSVVVVELGLRSFGSLSVAHAYRPWRRLDYYFFPVEMGRAFDL